MRIARKTCGTEHASRNAGQYHSQDATHPKSRPSSLIKRVVDLYDNRAMQAVVVFRCRHAWSIVAGAGKDDSSGRTGHPHFGQLEYLMKQYRCLGYTSSGSSSFRPPTVAFRRKVFSCLEGPNFVGKDCHASETGRSTGPGVEGDCCRNHICEASTS
jgi:hypothetical protein